MNGPSTISVNLDGGLFNFRVAGVAVVNSKLLLHKTPSDNFWSLPGGRADMFELTKETLLREMMEETGLTVSVENLMWVSENFFEYDEKRYHEIGFYYKMNFMEPVNPFDFTAIEDGSELLFHWHPLDDLHSIGIYPDFITAELVCNTSFTKHIVSEFRNLNLS